MNWYRYSEGASAYRWKTLATWQAVMLE